MYEFLLKLIAVNFVMCVTCLTRQLGRWPITTLWFTFELARSILIERACLNTNSKEHSTKLNTVQKTHRHLKLPFLLT